MFFDKSIYLSIYLRIRLYRLRLKYIFSDKRENIKAAFEKMENVGIWNIPIFIISFNRLSYVKQMVEWLEQKGYNNIHIIDNNSSYQPLLDFYKTLKHEVIYMKYNGGHMVFWNDSRFDKYRKSFYVVTDPDICPIQECPDDFITKWFEILKNHPYVRKIGFSLKCDDLPFNAIRRQVNEEWEKQFNIVRLDSDNIFFADIDTTMALYMPDDCCINGNFYRAFRTDIPYQARHLPWYKTVGDITEEDVFYSNLNKCGTWDIPKDYLKNDVNG